MAGAARLALGAVVRGALTLVAVAVLCWACLEAAPGDPRERAARVAGLLPAPGAEVAEAARARAIASVAASRDVAATPGARLARVLAGLADGTLGRAWVDGRPVTGHLARALPPTLALVGAALVVAWLAGLAGALLAAGRPGGARDRVVAGVAAVLLATPVAWLAILALRTFAWGSPWRVVPAHGSLTLAALCLGLPAAALVARYGRASLLGARGAPFFVAARARGLGPGRALAVHALGASAASLVALLPALVAATLGAAPVVEVAFDLPGLGSVLLDASSQGDAPRLVGGALAAGALVWLASTAAALLAPVLDPRGGDGA